MIQQKYSRRWSNSKMLAVIENVAIHSSVSSTFIYVWCSSQWKIKMRSILVKNTLPLKKNTFCPNAERLSVTIMWHIYDMSKAKYHPCRMNLWCVRINMKFNFKTNIVMLLLSTFIIPIKYLNDLVLHQSVLHSLFCK